MKVQVREAVQWWVVVVDVGLIGAESRGRGIFLIGGSFVNSVCRGLQLLSVCGGRDESSWTSEEPGNKSPNVEDRCKIFGFLMGPSCERECRSSVLTPS